ncbi:MAG: hypothetical protein JKY94_17695 [Rhodobacteraceae bacterium]|nr:hypothetical protein [Paracoccaceae bacterium]
MTKKSDIPRGHIGRTRGTPNKRTQANKKLLDDMGCNPLEALARLGMFGEQTGDLDLARKCYTTLAGYYAPQLSAIQVTAAVDLPAGANPISAAAAFVRGVETNHEILELDIVAETL